MSFCKNCDNSLDITKNVSQDVDNKNIKIIVKPDEFIKIINDIKKKGATTTVYQITFNEIILKNHLDTLNLSKEQYDEYINKYKEIFKQQKNISKFYFICSNCSSTYVLQSGMVLYSINLESSSQMIINHDEDLKQKCLDPILPRTKDYICPNKDCKSHKDDNIKEAVFYDSNKNNNISYICCACNKKWDCN